VAEHDLHLLGHDRAVAAGDRFQRILVHVVVEREHLFVERLPGIVLFVIQITRPGGTVIVRSRFGFSAWDAVTSPSGRAVLATQPANTSPAARHTTICIAYGVRMSFVSRTACSSFSAPPSMGCWSHMRIGGPASSG